MKKIIPEQIIEHCDDCDADCGYRIFYSADQPIPSDCPLKDYRERPRIICLCGSTRFGEAFRKAQLDETLKGKIVLTIGCNMKSDTEIFGNMPESELTEIKNKLDELHKRKIDLADEVLILNVDGYIGESTRSELEYAKANNKPIKYLVPTIKDKE